MTAPAPPAPTVSPDSTVHPRRWWILSTLVLCLLVVVLDNTILNVALKTIQQDLGATQSQLAWAVNSYTLVFAGLLFTYGVLGDRYGRRAALVVGLTLFACASVLFAFAFVEAMHTTATCSALVALLGALVVLRWLPGRSSPAATTLDEDAATGAAQ